MQKVLIGESKQAYGIEYKRRGQLVTAFAAKEIILSAGTIETPKILMLSGVGPKEHLEHHKVSLFTAFFFMIISISLFALLQGLSPFSFNLDNSPS